MLFTTYKEIYIKIYPYIVQKNQYHFLTYLSYSTSVLSYFHSVYRHFHMSKKSLTISLIINYVEIKIFM